MAMTKNVLIESAGYRCDYLLLNPKTVIRLICCMYGLLLDVLIHCPAGTGSWKKQSGGSLRNFLLDPFRPRVKFFRTLIFLPDTHTVYIRLFMSFLRLEA